MPHAMADDCVAAKRGFIYRADDSRLLRLPRRGADFGWRYAASSALRARPEPPAAPELAQPRRHASVSISLAVLLMLRFRARLAVSPAIGDTAE